jgi:hypothetical protein
MTALTWDQVGERTYETGVDKGVLYLLDTNNDYALGYAWNGLTTVTESPSGAESNPQYADNIKYLNLISAEEFGCTLEAFTYPEEFAACDGSEEVSTGVVVGQQGRSLFGLCYRTRFGNDVDGTDYGYKLHLVYGAQAAPSERAYGTINDSPEAIAFSWEVTTTPVPVTNLKPTALLVVDSTKVDPADLTTLENMLYGTVGTDPELPLPDAVIAIFAAGLTEADLRPAANQPTFVEGTGVVTLPNVTGVQWYQDGAAKNSGAQTAVGAGATTEITAEAKTGYRITGDKDWTFKRT